MPDTADSGPDNAERLALHLDGFEGPLDLLLELARGQKVDLARISILHLVEQYLAVMEGARQVRLELAADWLVMAAWLAWLKSRLLLPAEDRPPNEEPPADLLALRLQALDAIRHGAAWLAARPQLGHHVFRRGMPENLSEIDRSRLAADIPGLLRAYIAASRRAAGERRYAPRPMTLWSVQDALARLESLLGTLPPWTTLERFMPDLAEPTLISRRVAYASTLLAGLELARTGRIVLRQDSAFGPIEIGQPA
jgi:segregation and condensation protein A